MKKISALIVLFTLTVLVSSCSKDNKAAALEGRWEFSKAGTMLGSNEFLFPYEHAEGCNKDFVEFLAGGVYREHYHDNMGSECEVSVDNGTWARNGNTIALIVDGEVMSAEIITLSNTTLKIKTTFVDEDEIMPMTFIAEFVRR